MPFTDRRDTCHHTASPQWHSVIIIDLGVPARVLYHLHASVCILSTSQSKNRHKVVPGSHRLTPCSILKTYCDVLTYRSSPTTKSTTPANSSSSTATCYVIQSGSAAIPECSDERKGRRVENGIGYGKRSQSPPEKNKIVKKKATPLGKNFVCLRVTCVRAAPRSVCLPALCLQLKSLKDFPASSKVVAVGLGSVLCQLETAIVRRPFLSTVSKLQIGAGRENEKKNQKKGNQGKIEWQKKSASICRKNRHNFVVEAAAEERNSIHFKHPGFFRQNIFISKLKVCCRMFLHVMASNREDVPTQKTRGM